MRATTEHFVSANERMRDALSWLRADAEIPFVCECDDSACFGRVQLTRSEYDLLRTRGLTVRLPGHDADSEATEANGDRHSIVKNS
jgi:hypothetical protein